MAFCPVALCLGTFCPVAFCPDSHVKLLVFEHLVKFISFYLERLHRRNYLEMFSFLIHALQLVSDYETVMMNICQQRRRAAVLGGEHKSSFGTFWAMSCSLYEHELQSSESQVLTVFLADRTIGQAYGTVCRLSVCRLSSVTFCIVAKRCVLAKKCLKE